ncbi:MAG: glycosyltransferase [Kiloniellales bacterium]|nr:glycosyltransferase [Kiloniellales bacterium]
MSTSKRVAVCACTFRRPKGLQSLLEGLAAQTFTRLTTPEITIVIADNECSDVAERICCEFRQSRGIDLIYVREARRGIPFARNALLENIPDDATFFAMIDDDEVPVPEWLEELLLVQEETGAEVVRGPVVPEFPKDTPNWIVAANIHGWPNLPTSGALPHLQNGQEVEEGGTNNVLVKCEAVRRLAMKFDIRLGNMGGEDYMFFGQMYAAGCRIVYAKNAVVYAPVQAARASTSYVFLRQYQAALTHTAQNKRKPPNQTPVRVFLNRIKKSSFVNGLKHLFAGLGALVSSFFRKKHRDRDFALFILRTGYGVGLLSRLLQVKYEIYNKPAYNSEVRS